MDINQITYGINGSVYEVNKILGHGFLEKVYEKNPEKVKDYAKILYSQALLIEGMPLENPVEFSNLMVSLMLEANKE